MMNGIELIPSAKRLIRSLRDMGYDFCQAVADVVDNSVEAKATQISIDIEFDGDNSWVRIADNGVGMKPEVLREALRYGSDRDYEEEDLGKFGLGLKTASMSQCQRLSVASRWNAERADIAAYSWDLDHIKATNKWEILPIERGSLGLTIREPLKESTGTVVLWERLDRVLGYKHPYGEFARKRLSQMCRELELHLGMVFHRFLSDQRRRLTIAINGNTVPPWDPFCVGEPDTKRLTHIVLPIEHEGVSGKVLIEPFILPHQTDFTSPEAFRAASGPSGWNQQQGFYFYRAGRMIQSGGWSNLRAPDEHTKLARIAIRFAPALDDAFKINVAKMRVQLPSAIRDAVKDAVAPIVKLARETYDRKERRASHDPTPTGMRPERVASQLSLAASSVSVRISPPAPSPLLTLDQWRQKALSVSLAEERPIVEAVLNRLTNTKVPAPVDD
jgi:hypothetical protein